MQGRLDDGQTFAIPRTKNVLTSLLGKNIWRSSTQLCIAASLIAQLLLFVTLPLAWSRRVFLAMFICWRFLYNAGLGFVLHKQSTDKWIVKFVSVNRYFDKSSHPRLSAWLQRELEANLHADYDFHKAPLELNVWLCFRTLVDLILLNDFLSYCLFAWSWLQVSSEHSFSWHILRWLTGWALIAFNLAVKVDAHRVVTDLAWYWADAFFRSTQELVFDGIFELAPHPMYSVGYAGYYGLSLIVGSYLVFFVSLAAHLSQFMFLAFFESPHIERIYGTKSYIGRRPLDECFHAASASGPSHKGSPDRRDAAAELCQLESSTTSEFTTHHDMQNYYFYRDPILFRNIDLFRARDLFYIVAVLYAAAFSVLNASFLPSRATLLFLHALFWRIFHSVGLGWILHKQSTNQWLVRHFLKHYYYKSHLSLSVVREAFSNWIAVYNFSLTMTYLSFIMLTLSQLKSVSNNTWDEDIFRIVIGCLLIALHSWIARETFKSKVDNKYGDFFLIDYPRSLYYTGIYRFLNNPERIVGGAAFLGFSLFTNSSLVLALAIFSIVSHIMFLQLVENPHMTRLYGKAIRKESNLSRIYRDSVGGLFDSLISIINYFGVPLRLRMPFTAKLQRSYIFSKRAFQVLSDWWLSRRHLWSGSQQKLILKRVADVSKIDSTKYQLQISHDPSQAVPTFNLGEKIAVHWQAAVKHSRSDWIGIYKVGANESLRITNVSSQKKWIGVYPEEWSGDVHIPNFSAGPPSKEGLAEFSTLERLPSAEGLYEMRYHHEGKHNVLAISAPFEVKVVRPQSLRQSDMYYCLLTLVRYALHEDPAAVPKAREYSSSPVYADNNFYLSSKQDAASIAYGIEKAFGVELSPNVIMAAANVLDLTNTIVCALDVLSMHTTASNKED